MKWRSALLRVLVSVAVLTVVLLNVDLDQAVKGLEKLGFGWWVGALAAFLTLHAASALKWRYMLSLAGARIDASLALRCHGAGLFGNLCLPSLIGGDLVRAGLAMTRSRSPMALVLGSLMDRAADLGALLFLVLVGLLTAPGAGDSVPLAAVPIAAAILLALGGIGLGVLVLLSRPKNIRRIPRKLARLVIEGVRAFRTVRAVPVRAAAGLLACIAIQGGFVLVNAGLGGAVGLELDLGLWFLLWPLAKVAAMLPVSFGGLGVREAAFAALVAPFGSASLAVAQSLTWQSVLIAGGLVGGAYWAATSRRSARQEQP